MRWFVKKAGKYYAGGDPESESSWINGRKGAIVFQGEGAARARIDELGIEAEVEEY